MAGKKDKSKSRRSGLSRKDSDLWRTMTRDVRRLPERDYIEADETAEEKSRSAPSHERVNVQPRGPVKKEAAGKDVDRRTAQKFMRGQMEIEATIDLHGLGQAEAREALRRFITASHAQGKRCVLVITGKGLPGKPGILKTRTPDWLNEMGPAVLKIAPARPRHGGHGALYVLLRRQRA